MNWITTLLLVRTFLTKISLTLTMILAASFQHRLSEGHRSTLEPLRDLESTSCSADLIFPSSLISGSRNPEIGGATRSTRPIPLDKISMPPSISTNILPEAQPAPKEFCRYKQSSRTLKAYVVLQTGLLNRANASRTKYEETHLRSVTAPQTPQYDSVTENGQLDSCCNTH